MFRTGIMYEKNVLVSVENTDVPFGIKLDKYEEVSPGLFVARITLWIYGGSKSSGII